MTFLVNEGKYCLENSLLDEFGEILDQNWILKRKMSEKISSDFIDEIYSIAKNNGAIGGKILGAGGGGFLLLYCRASNQDKVRRKLSFMKEINFNFDTDGSKIIVI